jgi:hypothetical protein
MPVWKKHIARALLGFVLVSIGFALGRASAARGGAAAAETFGPAAQVVVYYLHGNVRCATCNKIEAMAKEVVESAFGALLRDGRVEWRVLNYQEREDLAKRYDVSASSVVVVKVRSGAERDFRRLDEVWQLLDEPLKFRACITAAVKSRLGDA